MARTEKLHEARSFSFRMPGEAYEVLSAVAKARSVDLSSVMNWIIAESMPHLLKEKADHEAAMLEAASSRVWARQPSTREAMRVLRDLLGNLQDEYGQLVKRSLEEDGDRRVA
jgi:hypothetical protein